MYIWVVLATFLAAIASYYLAPRNDMRELMVVPLAEAEIAKVVTQQKAARSYIGYHRSSAASSRPTYIIGELGEGEGNGNLEDYFPYGHRMYDNYRTFVYCVNADHSQLYATPELCFDDNTSVKYLITCGPLPLRWLNLNTEISTDDDDPPPPPPPTPTADFMTAMRHSVSADSGLGYTVCDDSYCLIFEHDQTQTEIPGVLLDSDKGRLKDYCDFDKDQPAIIYMSKI